MRKPKNKKISTEGAGKSLRQPVFREGLPEMELPPKKGSCGEGGADRGRSPRKKGGPAPVLRLRRETRGRGGKTVIVITGLPSSMSGSERKKLLQKLQSACASGGSLKDAGMEIQGDHRVKLEEILGRQGYRTIRAGG